jgi:serine/threonine protein phosphatase 1
MSLTYAIADLHGRFDLLREAMFQIDKHANLRPFKIITLGDYIDRGPDSARIISYLWGRQNTGEPLICLKGNHEAMMVETIRKPLHPDWWIGNGGAQTLISYGHNPKGAYDPTVVPKEHLDWINNLPIMHVDQHRVYVHAWVDSSVPLDKQKEDLVLWNLYPSHARYGHRLTGRHVVHGHDQHEDGPKLYPGRTNLDTLAWCTGRLVIGVFDDDKAGGPIDTIEIKLEPMK